MYLLWSENDCDLNWLVLLPDMSCALPRQKDTVFGTTESTNAA